jgi:hypothetical protein
VGGAPGVAGARELAASVVLGWEATGSVVLSVGSGHFPLRATAAAATAADAA